MGNPDPNHKICELINWYLDEEGYPIQERDGIIRWFVQRDSIFYWADTPEELKEKFGPRTLPISFSFISANIDDNPTMDEVNPSYRAYLEGLNAIDKARLLHGNWFVRPKGSNYFQRDWLHKLDKLPSDVVQTVRAWDLAITEPTEKNRKPDYTASVKMHKTRGGDIIITGDYIVDTKEKMTNISGRFRKRSGERDLLILKQAQYDGDYVQIVLPKDPAAGAIVFQEMSKSLASDGFIVKQDPTANNKSKLIRFEPFSTAAQNGLLFIVESTFTSETLAAFYTELEAFDGERSTSDRKDD